MVHKKSMRNIKRNSNKRSYRNIKRNVNKLSRKNIRKQIGGGGEEEINKLREYVEHQPTLNESLLTEMKTILDKCKPEVLVMPEGAAVPPKAEEVKKKKGPRIPIDQWNKKDTFKPPVLSVPTAATFGILDPFAASSGNSFTTATSSGSLAPPATPSGNLVLPAAPSGNSIPPATSSGILDPTAAPSIITERPKKTSGPVPLPKVSTIIQNNSPSIKKPPPIAPKPTSPLKHINSYIRVIQTAKNDNTSPNYKAQVAEYLKWIKKNNMTIDESLKNKLSEVNLLKIGLKKDGTEIPNVTHNFAPY